MRPLLDIFYNFRWVREGEAARSSQAHFGGLQRLMMRHGLRAVINLRGENSDLSWWRYEKRVCAALGAGHFDTMLDSRKLPTRPMLVCLMDAFDAAPKPFLLKCSGGNDRTGLAAALYLIHRDGWQAREGAQTQFAGIAKKHQRWLKLFTAFAQEEARGRAIGDWLRTDYTPEHFAEWLNMYGHGDSFERIFVAPTRSPFQW
ncbi:MAG: tyrosine-protein phosphatase [Alphaproteobacteria bacterium]|nr:tyrosine-protein phosphatase [Alphaproteobacteria bacterium]MDE1986028.1 tyrosine-protein phosphatase [Alphaproteobacteria bacterium]MDE2164041.1 tyrosine-protein phosphatase [Alphaproteobacteria bacterium]MDE2266751.1 tyrosine-protein phosphatase [Alphaproteobacteria bacterium]MDE2499631.1 tyrosine-protein phosphatase [Alphaproteobacteria bacterium]